MRRKLKRPLSVVAAVTGSVAIKNAPKIARAAR